MNKNQKALLTVFLLYVMWGLLPLYWHMLAAEDSLLVLCCRIVFAAAFALLVLSLKGRLGAVKTTLQNKAQMKWLLPATVSICLNWGVYVWAIMRGHTIDAGLGYYMNPLMVFAISVLLFKERCGKLQLAAVLIAAAGVAVSLVMFGKVPVMGLILAASFTAYGVFKKLAKADGVASIAVECMLLTPLALLFCLCFKRAQLSAITPGTGVLLVLAGAVTAIPVMLYSDAVKKVDFTTMGFMQYVSPTLQLFCGLLMGEKLTADKGVPLAFVLVALILYTIGLVRDAKKDALAKEAAKAEG